MMNLTIEEVSKLTKLSVSTLRVYTSRQKLGKKVGTRKVFSQADVQKLLKSSKKSPSKNKTKAPAKKTSKKTTKAEPVVASNGKAKSISLGTEAPSPKPTKQSFWTRLFGGRKEQQKVRLLDAKTTK
jgi:DNA-binding transcriptional MerR regulator